MKPIRGKVWILFDLENGNPKSKRYCRCFETKKLADDFRKFHIETYKNNGAKLSKPICYEEKQSEKSRDKGQYENFGANDNGCMIRFKKGWNKKK